MAARNRGGIPLAERQITKKPHSPISTLGLRHGKTIKHKINDDHTHKKTSAQTIVPQVVSQGELGIAVTSHAVKPSFSIYCDEDLTRDAHDINTTVPSLGDTVEQHAERVQSATVGYTGTRKPLAELKCPTDFSQMASAGNIPNVTTADLIVEQPDTQRIIGQMHEDKLNIGYCTLSAELSANEDSLYGSANDENSEYHTAPMSLTEKERDNSDMLCIGMYIRDTYAYMRHRELRIRPRAHYISKQSDINAEMRRILVDWLADVVVEYELHSETFHLTVSLIDRTLSVVDCPRLKLQLIGAAAIMLASKYEEIYPPSLKEYVYITDDTYSTAQILRMERVIMSAINFDISAPTSNWFALRLARLANADHRTVNAMNYLLELALLDLDYLKYRASVLASAAFCMANVLTGPTPWSVHMEQDTGITVADMMEILVHLLQSFNEAPKASHKAIYEKYSEDKFDAVALIVSPKSLPTVA